MHRKNISLNLPEGEFTVKVIKFNEIDRVELYKIYRNWRELCNQLKQMGGRGVNLPEVLSESAFCLEMGAVRVIGNISGANSSWDCYSTERNARIQIKACSVLPDLTSFGPRSVWDEIYFVDFYKKGKWDGKFDIYHIKSELIYNHYVNQTQTFREQQNQGRRPRFSIYKELIIERNIAPILTGCLCP